MYSVLAVDTFEDLTQAYPHGWLRSVLRLADTLQGQTGQAAGQGGQTGQTVGANSNSIKSIAKICVGAHHTVLLDDASNVYTFGLGDGGQLGQGTRRSSSKPKLLEKLQTLLLLAEPNGGKGGGGTGGNRCVHVDYLSSVSVCLSG